MSDKMTELQLKSEKELLAEIVLQQRRSARRSLAAVIIAAVCVLCVVVAGVIVIPRAVNTMNSASSVAAKAEETFQKVEEIDIDSLNQSIHSLSDILEPVASFFSAFK